MQQVSNIVNEITLKGRKVTRADVEAAMAECDAMGMDEFLSFYGFRRAALYWLRGTKNHRPYPSKAILAVAARCTKRHGFTGQFFGGVAHTVNRLNRLGFKVRVGETPEVAENVDDIRRKCVEAGFNNPQPAYDKLDAVGVTPVAIFASGSNTAKIIKGMAAARMDVGVAAPHISRVCKVCRTKKAGSKTECDHSNEAALHRLAGTDVQVFCDSGAFSEVEFNPAKIGFDVVKPITDAKWDKILSLYERLGSSLSDQAWLVAPDQVGSQDVTLERLERFSERLQKIADTGAIIMVVAQKGALSQADFYRAAIKAAGLEGRANVVPALPCKKAATTPEEAAEFVADLQPDHVHCLGLGPTNQKITSYMAAFVGTTTSVSLDSCWITANVGKAKGKTKAKRYTLAQQFVGAAMTAMGIASDLALKLEVALALCLAAPLPKWTVIDALAHVASLG